jgi:hypothetical protein
MEFLSVEDGKYALALVRKTVEKYTSGQRVETPVDYPEALNRKCGVFCTLNKVVTSESWGRRSVKKELRGCIGVPQPGMKLIDALVYSSKNACEDPRFPKLQEEELKNVKIEVSILTVPEKIEFISPSDLLKRIAPHKDGLMIKYGPLQALFLPQVWEQVPEKENFLRNLCIKAGLYPDTWKDPKIEVYRFHVQIFEEK